MICLDIVAVRARRPRMRLLMLIIAACLVPVNGAPQSGHHADRDEPTAIGTWTGTSICVGDRPACKNEVVVYRFLAVEGDAGLVTLLADKIIDGKREPMYKLQFQYNRAARSLTCEFRKGQTHGIWAYEVSGDTMTGTLVVLPDKALGRRVNVHRVRDDQVPKAPPLDEYGV